jgi:hypothetical protein
MMPCESFLCDVEGLDVTHGISTNFIAGKIIEELLSVLLFKGRPTAESLRNIANNIISIVE